MLTINQNNKYFRTNSKKVPSFQMNYKITRLPNVSDNFVQSIKNSIKSLPDIWEEVLSQKNYKLYCADSIKSVFQKEGLQLNEAPDWDAVTCSHPNYKFFVFTPKLEEEYIQKAVNHEVSHGIVDSEEIMDKFDIYSALNNDSSKYKPNHRSPKNLWNIKSFLCCNLSDYQKNEIVTDTLAWMQLGGGIWDSGYKKGINNPNFLKENFPTVNKIISEYKVGEYKTPKYTGYEPYDPDDVPF